MIEATVSSQMIPINQESLVEWNSSSTQLIPYILSLTKRNPIFWNHHDNCSFKNLVTPHVFSIFSSTWFLAIVYCLVLLYLFLGIAIISDIFMNSIEVITSQTKIIKVYSSLGFPGVEEKRVKIWNDSVANLTLMALGSSAPEILLSITEIVGSGFVAGELGPGTIVGSAAFNLLIISAVCVTALQEGQVKSIREINVFIITSFFSVFAYIWLFLILVVISPEIIELWEAIITFGFFPLLVFLAYLADRNFFRDGTLGTSTVSRRKSLRRKWVKLSKVWVRQFKSAMDILPPNHDSEEDESIGGSTKRTDNGRCESTQRTTPTSQDVQVKEEEEPTILDYVLHAISFQWKVAFASVPPPRIWGGWATFLTSLVVIGILTAIVGDVATTFGCLIGLEQSVNAITFVAMGTSLPDLFASRIAVMTEATADNAIGNVTGSNSVNVFLGLGLPWLMAAIHWTVQGKAFKVPSGNLGFAVALYTAVAILAIGLLVLRRFVVGGEVGGSKKWAMLSGLFLTILWFIYIILSALQSYGILIM